MKNFFDRQLILYFKKNIIYFIFLFFLLFLILYLIFLLILNNSELSEKIKTINEQNINLKRRIEKLDNLKNYNLEENIKLVNKIIPNNDDIFTVIYTLINLGNNLNVAIPYFEVNANQIKRGKFSIKVDIIADDILNFLNNYLLSSGRLITISSLKINTEGNKYPLDLHFYNYKPDNINSFKNSDNIISNININLYYINKINEMIEEGKIVLNSKNKDNNFLPNVQYNYESINSSENPFSPN